MWATTNSCMITSGIFSVTPPLSHTHIHSRMSKVNPLPPLQQISQSTKSPSKLQLLFPCKLIGCCSEPKKTNDKSFVRHENWDWYISLKELTKPKQRGSLNFYKKANLLQRKNCAKTGTKWDSTLVKATQSIVDGDANYGKADKTLEKG